MPYNPHRTTAPKTLTEKVEDALLESGGHATILALDKEKKTVRLLGDYADKLLARRALDALGLEVE